MKNQFQVILSADVATVTTLPAGLNISSERAEQFMDHVLQYFKTREKDADGNSTCNKFDLYAHASSIAENANELAFLIGFAETALREVSGNGTLGQLLNSLTGGR